MNAHSRDFILVEQGALRQRIEAAIESLLAMLDELDGDVDVEPNGDELDGDFDDYAFEDDDPAEEDDFAEDDDPAGGDVLDEPHDDANTFDGVIADADAALLLKEELDFWNVMDASRAERLQAHEETRRQIAKVTGRMPRSHWSAMARLL